MMAGKQFDAAAFLEFCRGKPADEEYNFCHHAQCALGQFGFSVHGWSDATPSSPSASCSSSSLASGDIGMGDLLKLAERCEQATGPDRELDAEIGVAMGVRGEPWGRIRPFGPVPAGSIRDPKYPRGALAFALYTASLDAAMTLVPEDADFTLDRITGAGRPDLPPCVAHLRLSQASGAAATPALALTAACLRARDSGSDPTGEAGTAECAASQSGTRDSAGIAQPGPVL